MRLKHNKKRNTAFVYEALVRELTSSVIRSHKSKQNKIVNIINKYFKNGSPLSEELELYRSIYETKDINKSLAEKIVVEAKTRYSKLNKGGIFKHQSELINTINKTLSKKIFTNFVPNYKSLASIYSIFQEQLPVKDRVLLEENIIQQMSSSLEQEQLSPSSAGHHGEVQQPIDSIVYTTFVSKFNEKYSDTLNESQKSLISKYISSFSDNGLDLKIYLNDELGLLKQKLKESMTAPFIKEDADMLLRMKKIYDILESYKKKDIDEDLVEMVLRTQFLLEEIEK